VPISDQPLQEIKDFIQPLEKKRILHGLPSLAATVINRAGNVLVID
jgi:hypothetical protein